MKELASVEKLTEDIQKERPPLSCLCCNTFVRDPCPDLRRQMCRPLPLVPIARGYVNFPGPQDQFGKSKSHDKSIDTAKEKT